MTVLLANMRMYSVSTSVAAFWKRLADRVAAISEIPICYFDHPSPAPMTDLWKREDMGLVQMCGWPFWMARPRPQIIAAAVLDCDLADDRPDYWTDMIVAAENPAMSLEDTFGGTIAWTERHSQSGFNAPRALVLDTIGSSGTTPYKAAFGPVVTPAGAIDAVCSGKADVAGLDGYYHLLLKVHKPEVAARIKTIARTRRYPIPPFVASAEVGKLQVRKLSRAMVDLSADRIAHPILQVLRIRQFVVPDERIYEATAACARKAQDCSVKVADCYGENE